MKKGKRILSLLLVFVLVLGLLPMSAFAAVVGGDNISKELEAKNPLTYYVSRLTDVPGKAPVVRNNNGKNIINRTSNYGSATSGNSLTGITGAAFCADHTKGIKGPYYPVKITTKNDVPSQWPNWIRGIMASGYPTKTVKQQVGEVGFEWVTTCEGVARESGCTVVGITSDQWAQLQNLANNGTFDEFCWEAATQLAVWHATQGIEIKGGINPNTGKSQWSKSGETVSVANNTDTKSTAIIIAARYILVNGWQWAEKVNSTAVNAGGFFGIASEVGGNGVLNHVITDSGTDGSVLTYSGVPDSANWAPRSGEQDYLSMERLLNLNENGVGYTVQSRGNPKMLLDSVAVSEAAGHPNNNVFRQTINGTEYVSIYFELYSETIPVGTPKVTIAGLQAFNDSVASLNKGKAMVVMLNPVGGEYNELRTPGDTYNASATGITTDTTVDAPCISTATTKTTTLGIGTLAERENGGNGTRSIFIGKLCIPVALYDATSYPQADVTVPGTQTPISVALGTKATSYDVYYGAPTDSTLQPVILKDTNPAVGGSVAFSWGELEKKPAQTGLSALKLDQDTNLPVGGAEFTLTCVDANCPLNGTTMTQISNNSGLANFGIIKHEDGSACTHMWTLTESKRPDGYLPPTIKPECTTIPGLVVTGPWTSSQPVTLDLSKIPAGESAQVAFKNPKPDENFFTIRKVDAATNQPLAGVKFVFTCEDSMCSNNGTLTPPAVTDKDGKIIFRPPMCEKNVGTEEEPNVIEVPCTHTWRYTEEKNFTINGMHYAGGLTDTFTAGESKEVRLENIPTIDGNEQGVTIRKTDSLTGALIPGAVFSVKNINTNTTYTFTATSGEMVLTCTNSASPYYVPQGAYVVTEKRAPDGYIKSDQMETFTFDNYGTGMRDSTFTFENQPKHRIVLEKMDANSGDPISGVSFDYWKDGRYMGAVGPTNDTGRIELYDIQTGTYEFKERVVPSSYIKTDKTYSIYVDCSDDNQDVNHYLPIENYLKKSIVITKEDAETGLKLSGARFNVRGMGNSFTTTVETDATGTALVEGLGYGTYLITETRAPVGYEISEEPFTLVIDEDSTDDTIYLPAFQDNPMAGLMIQKIDSTTKQAIPNVGFKVEYLGEGGTQVENHITDANGLIILPDTKAGWYRITETTTPAGYVKNSEPQMVQVTNTHEPVTVTFENDQTGLLNILKLETNTGLPLAGARFEIRTAGGDLVETVTTGGNGYATYSGLTPGGYIVQEVEAPDHHVIDPYPQSFEVKAGDAGKTYLLVFHNTDMGSFYIRKVDANTNQAVAGAVFKVTDSEGKVIAERVVTGEDGLALVDRLETGTYIVTEIKAPDGYLLDAPPQTVMLYAGQTKTLTFRDNKPGGIAIKKVDAATAAVLPGAVFELYDLDDHKLGGSYTTGEDGIARINDLEPGYYYIKEIQAPDGYQCDGRPIRVKVEAFLMTEVTVTNTQKSSLTIEKRDKETNVLLESATFKVTRRDGSVIAENLVTGKSGTVTINGLAEGDYYVTETKAPAGYLLNTEAQLVAVKGDEASIVTFYNQVKKNMVIRKVDSSTNLPLAGATFDLYHLNGALVGTYTTDTSGTITTQALEPGFYTLKETHAPDGYEAGWIPNATTGSATAGGSKVTQQTIEVPAGQTVTVTIPNTPLPVIEIQKADSVTGKPLMGAQFTVANERGNVIGTYTTGSAGSVFTEKLPSGWYTVTEVKAPNGYVLDAEPMRVKLTAGVPTVARFVNDPKTSLLITKIDDATSKPLAYATFELRTLEGEKVGEYTTGANGTVSIAPVAPGKYQLVEVDAPDGYMLDSTAHNVTVNAGVVNSITIRNKAFPTLTVFKGDSTGKPLPGATIKLETADGDFVAQGVTDSAGEIIFTGIKPGHYIVTETQAPTGYEKVSDPVVTTVKYGVNNRVELVNAQWGGLLIKLTDQKDGKPLANGQFTVTHCADNAIVYTGTTDTAGTILVGNLIPGDKYIVTQTMAPDGYTIVDKEKSEFVVAGENRLVLFEDATAGIVIEKVDALTGKTLAGARFQLTRNSDNIVIGEYVTGTDGLALASGLTPGMYTVEELVAPENYTIDEGPKLVHVKANTTAHVTFKDTPFAGITIKSIDSVTNKPIAGTVFEVYEQNGELVNSYTTDATGTAETGVLAPGHYVIKQTYVKDGYEPKDTERTVEIKDGKHVTETFYSVPAGTLNVYAVDNSYKGLPGMRVTVTKINGEFVANGLTDTTGVFTVTGLAPGYYVVTETKSPNGYLIGTVSKNILVMAGKPANVYFPHDKTYGVQILTTVKQTNEPLVGVQYQVTKPNGEIIKTYTSDEAGYIYVPLDPGDYVITPVSVPNGYTIADSQKITVVKANKYSTVNFVATQLSSIRVQLVDGQTGKGIYGVRLLVKDSSGNIVSECWTNNEGKIVLTKELPDGTYVLEQITVPDGYAMDKIPKTVQILNGQTTEVTWTLWKVVGQVQVELRSSDYNSILDKAQNSLLYGGVFEVIDPVSYQVVATMTTDAYGVAATKGLPLGRYLVRQLSAPAYYANSTQVSEVTLKVANDVVRVNFYDPSLALTVAVDHKSNNNVAAGQVMRVDVLEVSNNSNTALSNAYWTIKVPTDCARIGTFYTGSWNQAVWYSASYKTNMTDYRDLAKNLNSTTNNQFDLSSTALGLQNGEYVTEVRLEFGTVPANWKLVSQPAFMLYILPGVYDTYKVITRMEYGGKYLDAWVSNTSLWTTNVLNPKNKSGIFVPDPNAKFPSSLPKTGY